jgi:tetratricopeptide (TPR) repeat protein
MPIEDILVAIFTAGRERVVGAGIVVDKQLVLTCSHVVNEALGRFSSQKGRPSQDKKIPIRLHLPSQDYESVLDERAESWIDPAAEDYPGADLCVLRILGNVEFPKIAHLCSFENLVGQGFRAAGFPPGWDIDFAFGTIRGRDKIGLYLLRPEPPLLGTINERGNRLFNKHVRPPGVIHSGFSGSPVEVQGRVTGILVEAREKISDATAYMIPVSAFPSTIAHTVRRFHSTSFQLPRAPVPFIGRDSELAEIIPLIEKYDAVIIYSTFPGIGKTALAIHLAHRIRTSYPDGVFWIRASDDVSATLFATVSAFGLASNWLSVQSPAEALAASLAQFLSVRRALVIYDDVRFYNKLELLLPTGTSSKFVITTRISRDVDQEGLTQFSLSLLSPHSALELFKHVSGSYLISELDKGTAQHIVAELGYLPLAIRLAGRTIRTLKCSISEYLSNILEVPDLTWVDSDDVSESLSASLFISYRTLSSDTDRELFRCLGLVHSIPANVGAISAALEKTAAITKLSIRNLLRAGLCDWRSNTSEVSIHPLLRRYARELAAEHDTADTHRRLARWFESQLSVRNADGTFRYSDLISFRDVDAAKSATHHYIQFNDNLSAQRVVEVIADALTRSGQHDALLKLISELSSRTSLTPWLHLYQADLTLMGLGHGIRLEARLCLTKLAEHSDSKVATAALICLAKDSYRIKEIDKCKLLLLKAKELKENAEPPDKRGLPYVLNELARLELLSQNGVRTALSLHNEALEMQKSQGDVKGQAHTLRRIGSIFLRQKRNPKQASDYLTEACLAAERAGSTLILIHSLIELAEAEQRFSDFGAALEHLKDACELAKKSSDPFTSLRVDTRMGQTFERLELWGAALGAYERAEGYAALAKTYDDQTRLVGALTRVREKIESLRRKLAEWEEEIQRLNVDIQSESLGEQRTDLLRRRRHASRMRKRVRQKLGLDPSKIRMRRRFS